MIIKRIEDVKPGTVLGKTIYGENYEELLKKGVALTEDHINRLKKRGYMAIFVEEDDTKDINIQEMVSDEKRVESIRNIIQICSTIKSWVGETKNTTYKTIIEHINKEEIKKSFQDSYEFKTLRDDIKLIVDEIMTRDTLLCLDIIKSHDNYIYEHSVDTGIIALIIAKKLFLTRKRLEQIAIGTFLHDIGMMFIDKKILKKTDKLTEEEYKEVQGHTTYGYKLLKGNENIGFVAAHIAYQHHERQDGTGYPRGLMGTNKLNLSGVSYEEKEKLIMPAEIASIADFYDACISDRPFRPALPHDLVYELIKGGAGTQFNRELVKCFLEIIPKYPVGSKVKIKNSKYEGFTGYVIAISNREQLCRPKIRLLHDSKKNKIAPIEIDLSTGKYPIDLECI